MCGAPGHYATKETDTVGRLLLQHQVICDSAPRLSG